MTLTPQQVLRILTEIEEEYNTRINFCEDDDAVIFEYQEMMDEIRGKFEQLSILR